MYPYVVKFVKMVKIVCAYGSGAIWGVGYVGTLVKMVKIARACCWGVGLVPLPSENCEN